MNPKPSQPQQPSSREKSNRILGLSSYAGAIIMAGLIVLGARDEIRMGGWAGLIATIKKDPTTPCILVAATVVLWAIGFTTGRRKPPTS